MLEHWRPEQRSLKGRWREIRWRREQVGAYTISWSLQSREEDQNGSRCGKGSGEVRLEGHVAGSRGVDTGMSAAIK